MKKLLSAFLVLSMLFSALTVLSSCSEDTPPADGTTAVTDVSEEVTTADPSVYVYPEVELNNMEFRVLSFESLWNTNIRMDFSETSGVKMNDAVYDRNRNAEQKMGFILKWVNAGPGGTAALPELCQRVAQSVIAGDNAYEAAYLPVAYSSSIITDGTLMDIASLPNVQLDREWWDKSISDALSVNGKSMVASSSANLMTLDMAWVLLFNHNLLDDRKTEHPYQLVKDGKWTLDKMLEYETGIASLNGDASWTLTTGANAVYGVGRHQSALDGFLYGADVHVATLNSDNTFTYDFGGDRMIAVLEKVDSIFEPSAGNGVGSSGSSSHYLNIVFKADRSLFVTCELKATMELRDMESQFGLLPFPKYDETQDGYRTNLNRAANFLCIPSYVKNTAGVGAILDVLSYEGYQSMLPVYYDEVVTYQGLRNEESIAMLEIIRTTRGIDFSQVYGITKPLHDTLASAIMQPGVSAYASTIASMKDSVVASADEILKILK